MMDISDICVIDLLQKTSAPLRKRNEFSDYTSSRFCSGVINVQPAQMLVKHGKTDSKAIPLAARNNKINTY